MDNQFRVIAGKVCGDWLVSGPHRQYKLLGTNMYNKKEGFFLVRDGVVLRFVPYANVLKVFGMDTRPKDG